MAQRLLTRRARTCACSFNPSVDRVSTVPGLSMTPAEVAALTKRGIAVSLPNLQVIPQDGVSPDTVPLEFRRGSGLCETWEAEQRSKDLITTARKEFDAQTKKRFKDLKK